MVGQKSTFESIIFTCSLLAIWFVELNKAVAADGLITICFGHAVPFCLWLFVGCLWLLTSPTQWFKTSLRLFDFTVLASCDFL